MKFFSSFVASALAPVLALALIACASAQDDGTGTAGGSALAENKGNGSASKTPPAASSGSRTPSPSASASTNLPPAARDVGGAGASCGGGVADENADGFTPTCLHDLVCRAKDGGELPLGAKGTCQPAKPGEMGADCKQKPDCNAGLDCLPLTWQADLNGGVAPTVCTLPDFGTEGGGCEGMTDTECQDGLTCVRENPSDDSGICKKP